MKGALIVAALLLASTAGAAPRGTARLEARLDARQNVPPQVFEVPGATGRFTAILSPKNEGTLTWRLTYRGLSGKATGAHIHIGRRGEEGPPAVVLCSPCVSPARGKLEYLTAPVVRAILAGSYVNVHTRKNLDGELRGQLVFRK